MQLEHLNSNCTLKKLKPLKDLEYLKTFILGTWSTYHSTRSTYHVLGKYSKCFTIYWENYPKEVQFCSIFTIQGSYLNLIDICLFEIFRFFFSKDSLTADFCSWVYFFKLAKYPLLKLDNKPLHHYNVTIFIKTDFQPEEDKYIYLNALNSKSYF